MPSDLSSGPTGAVDLMAALQASLKQAKESRESRTSPADLSSGPGETTPCPDCGQSGYASTYDGQTLGECGTCNGFGAVPSVAGGNTISDEIDLDAKLAEATLAFELMQAENRLLMRLNDQARAELAEVTRQHDKAQAGERARIVAGLRRRSELNGYAAVYADLIEKGEI